MFIEIPGYTLKKLLYEGKQTFVYRALRNSDHFPVIIKILREEHPPSKHIVQLQHEYAVIRELNNSKIIQVFGLENFKDRLFLILEDFEGESLADLIKKRKIDLETFLWIAIELAHGIAAIHHQQIIHKDIKPQNIIVNLATKQVKIIDFGTSTLLSREIQQVVTPENLEGTIAYISPEQTGRMTQSVDYRTDIYSLGVTLYEMITGKLPFQSKDFIELVYAHIAKHPQPPHESNPNIPEALSAIIMKCLAKNAEERYHSAYGLVNDLIECRRQLAEQGQILPFLPGQHDLYDQFQIPPKLYGRKNEIAFIQTVLERCFEGASEMLIIDGDEGVGKSALINEIEKTTIQKHGHFISGKFNQLKLNLSHEAFTQAFKVLIQHLLSESDEELAKWRQRFLKALGKNGQLIIDLIPELQLIIGEQPPLLLLDPELSENRFIHVFINFISSFLHKPHPLVIFLDDLNLAYPSSLKLLEHLISDTTLHYLLVIGSYRASENMLKHPLHATIEKIRNAGGIVETLTIQPLALEAISELIQDTFHNKSEEIEAIAKLTYQKTRGNPFFIREFLQMLYKKKMINFDPLQQHWKADLDKIKNLNVTDNVAALLSKKMQTLSFSTQKLLQMAAVIGNVFDLRVAARLAHFPPKQAELLIAEASNEELVFPGGGIGEIAPSHKTSIPPPVYYTFHHERIRQAAYQLIPAAARQRLHLKIGKALLQEMSEKNDEDGIVLIVNHLNYAINLIKNEGERQELANLNLIMGKKAQNTIAYRPAMRYYLKGISLLRADCWQTQYALSFELFSNLAACQLWSGNHIFAKKTINIVLKEAKSIEEKVKIYITLLALLSAAGKYQEAIDCGIDALKLLGITLTFPINSTKLFFTWLLLKLRINEKSLKKLPIIKDEKIKLIGDIYNNLSYSAMAVDARFIGTILSEQIKLSLDHGLSENSSTAFMTLAMLLASENFQRYDDAYKLATFFMNIITHFPNALRNNEYVQASYIVVSFWKLPFKKNLTSLVQLERECHENGNIETAIFCANLMSLILLFSGNNLDQISQELIKINARASTHKNIPATIQAIFLAFCEGLKGLTDDPTDPRPPNSPDKLDGKSVPPFYHSGDAAINFTYYATLKVFLLYLHDKFEEAIILAKQIEKPLYQNLVPGLPIWTQCYFAHALSLSAIKLHSHSKLWRRLKLRSFLKRAKKWAEACPQNYLHHYLLIQAECFRLDGKHQAAMHGYERAISAAEENGFPHEVAIVYEVAARAHLAHHMPVLAASYMREAYYGYIRWGAVSKFKSLASKYQNLLHKDLSEISEKSLILQGFNRDVSTQTSISKPDFFDIGSIMQASQAISEEIILDKLREKLLRISMINAGAERAFFISVKNNQPIIQAEISENRIAQIQPIFLEERKEELALAIVYYVMRTKKELLLNDACNEGHFTQDDYIKLKKVKSLLCLPLNHQGKMIGLLYFENNLNKGTFTAERLKVLKLLSTQMAICIENALFYANLEESVEERTKELKQAQAQLIQQEKMASLGMLTAGIAHEIKNPLNFIINFSELSVGAIDDLEKLLNKYQPNFNPTERELQSELMIALKTNLKTIVEQGERADRIVKKMLEHSRAKPGEVTNTDLHVLVEDCIKFVYHGMYVTEPTIKIKIEKKFDVTIDQIKISGKELSHVILNLLSNSFYAVFQKARQQGSSFTPIISITTKNLGQECQIRIRDNGYGIPIEEQNKIFSPFYTTKPTGQGTGLGLSISHTIMTHQLGGSLTFNTQPGEYAEFIITFPHHAVAKI